jgi:uncharacterized protein YbjT (DUF2867 family)
VSERVLVMGATGYVGSRLVPRLAEETPTLRVLVRDPERAQRFGWCPRVEMVTGDVLDATSVETALTDVTALVYLVHGMDGDDFAETDAKAAELVGAAAAAHGVRRIVFLSGLVPDIEETRLSEHLASRLEVERILASHVPTVTIRAAVVLGSGSASFEVIRQLAERLPVHTVPTWMSSTVQPVAVTDVVDALAAASAGAGEPRAYDLGGPDRLSYPDLLRTYCAVAGLARSQVPLPAVPTGVVAELAARFTDVSTNTVRSLVESLHHDMVCRDDDAVRDLLGGRKPLELEVALHRALVEPDDTVPDSERDLLGPMSYDPEWASGGRQRGSWTAAALADARDRAAETARSIIDG